MKLTYEQLIAIPFGYSYRSNYRVYKARMSKESGQLLVSRIANAQITNTFFTKSGFVIITVIDGITSNVWSIIDSFKPVRPAKQLTLNL